MNEEEKKMLEIFEKEVEKEQQEYENVNDYTQFFYNNHKVILNLIQKQQAEIENLNADKEKLLVQCGKKVFEIQNEMNKEIDKKDKIIDEIAKYIYKREDNKVNIGRIYCPLNDCDDINRDVECDVCIKQYFEKKVEE